MPKDSRKSEFIKKFKGKKFDFTPPNPVLVPGKARDDAIKHIKDRLRKERLFRQEQDIQERRRRKVS